MIDKGCKMRYNVFVRQDISLELRFNSVASTYTYNRINRCTLNGLDVTLACLAGQVLTTSRPFSV